MHLDSGHDARENRERLLAEAGVDYLIKWNPRHEEPRTCLHRLEQGDLVGNPAMIDWQTPREGKRVASDLMVMRSSSSSLFAMARPSS